MIPVLRGDVDDIARGFWPFFKINRLAKLLQPFQWNEFASAKPRFGMSVVDSGMRHDKPRYFQNLLNGIPRIVTCSSDESRAA
jgi:hypothetical protein